MRNKNCCARNKLGRCAASVLAIVTALTACTSDGYRYSTDYPCNFTFYVSYHQTSVLARVLDNPGLYVWVEVQKKLGVNHLMVHPTMGSSRIDYKSPLTITMATRNVYSIL